MKEENYGRFQTLQEKEEEEEEEESESEEIDAHVLRVGRATEILSSDEPYYTIDELINGDDRFQARCFLASMEEHMRLISNHFDLLKHVMRERNGDYSKSIKGIEYSSSSDLQMLLECVVACNLATESVKTMESALAANFPHLSSFYTVIAVVFLPNFIDPIEARLSPKQREKNLAKIFIGEVIECMFHNKKETKVPQIARNFSRDTNLDEKFVEELATTIAKHISFELQLEINKAENTEINRLFQRNLNIKPHRWMKNNYFIRGDRSILNTHLLIQKVFDVIQPNRKLISYDSFFGKM